MEAPIPASALIHSATLVSAGFYLLIRNSFLLENSVIASNMIVISSVLTMLVASLIASTQTDVKKLLAYSTISNCAFIYLLIGLHLYNFAILYFAVHGMLKSLSFMIGGLLIKNLNHYQDMRN
jgi:NADH-quinone oxidoreductase subunit L